IARAAEEEAVPADALEQLPLAALFALLAGRDAGFVGHHLVARTRQVHHELLPKLAHRVAPRKLAFLDFVELFLEARRKGDVEDVVERFHQENADAFAEHRWREASLFFLDVLALDNRRDNRGIGRGPADPLFFELLYQGRFRVTRRRLGEVLIRAN